MDQLRFGAIDHPDTARVVHGVVSGISFYGNCLGLPNIGGETFFDSVYQGNPLVNALAVGVMRHEDIKLANASGAGNKVVLFGARTGGDGIGGASILASDTFADGGPTKRPAVQVGDPFAEKGLIECCLELYRDELVEAIQDLGAAGISCATSELAANGGSGMKVDLEEVLLRDPRLTPEEILMSESQERMMAIVAPEKLDAFLAVTAKWDVETSVLGEVTGDGRLVIHWHGQEIVNVDPATVAVDGPVYERPVAYPTWIDALQEDSASALPRATDSETLRTQFAQLLSSPNLADKSWLTNQYDYYVMGNTALAFPDDAGMIRVDEESGLGFAIATDCDSRFCQLDPYEGARHAVAEAYRNVAVTGAKPVAVTDCLNFGSPENPEQRGQEERAAREVRPPGRAQAKLGSSGLPAQQQDVQHEADLGEGGEGDREQGGAGICRRSPDRTGQQCREEESGVDKGRFREPLGGRPGECHDDGEHTPLGRLPQGQSEIGFRNGARTPMF